MKLGKLLTTKGLLSEQQVSVALGQQRITGDLLGETLVKLGFVTSKEIAQTLAEQSELRFIDLDNYPLSDDALRLVPRETAERTGFLPLRLDGGALSIGITNPNNILAIDTATKISGKPPHIYMIDSESFYEKLEVAYYFLKHPLNQRIDSIINEIKSSGLPTGAMTSSLTELLIMDGIRRRSTDIHITPALQTVHVFYRIDGVLHHSLCFPKNAQNGVISRIKILSQLDIAENRLPQDGSFSFDFLNKKYDMRVSTIPTIYGENIVIRILKGSGPLLRISNLGFQEEDAEKVRLLFLKPYGIILITGPTGSGKTTTLYAALREINLLEKNVLTVEDPVEYRLSMVKQTEVNEKAGYGFATAGRNFMRQDPDVLLLGEIRDEDTARIAIRASITGHLVLTTLHTNDAVTAIPRLIDFNVDKYLLSASLVAIIAQRLVRKICLNCRTEYELAPDELRKMGFVELEGKIKKAFKGTGCIRCDGTGYAGRTVIGEILVVDDYIKELIYLGASVGSVKETAVKNGMQTLRDDGIKKAIEGLTTFSEISRVAG